MPVYKDNRRNKWYARLNYTDVFGKQRSKKSKGFDTKREANEELARMQVSGNLAGSVKTFNDVHIAYVEDQKKIVKPITASHYDPLYAHIKPLIGDIQLSRLTMSQYKAIKNELDNTNLSTSRKNRLHKHIKTLCKYAATNYDIVCTVPEKAGGFYDQAVIKDDELKFITEEQFNQFIACFDNIVLKTFYTVLFYQGLRQGEALALTFNDVDLSTCKLRINKTYTAKINKDYKSQKYYITSPKTKNSNRTIPINKKALECLKTLKEYYKEYDKFKEDWFVFGGAFPMSETTICNKKDQAFKECGIDRITIHQFRHSCASYLFEHGADPVSVQHFLGHSKLSTTMDIYVHLKNEKLNDIFNFE